jgi:DNA-binding transcriptional MocR family regulator
MDAFKKELLYLQIAEGVEHQIRGEVLKVGDRLPSVRTICREHGVSMSTALQAYSHLESKALIVSRPQSGYFVSSTPRRLLALPEISRPASSLDTGDMDELVARVYDNFGQPNLHVRFSLGVPDNELLPVAKLNKALVRATRNLPGSGVAYEHPMGNENLRKQVARWSLAMGAKLDYRNIITTAGCLNAISCCLLSLAKRGDAIAMESPVSFGMLQVARSLGLEVVELPTHPETGIEVDALKNAIVKKRVKLCLLISNFSNPLGSCMPDDHKQAVVRLLEKYRVPLIENDLNGDIYFGSQRPHSCKTYDREGWVLWCGSVSKSLAPGYRVGWVDAGQFRERLLQTKQYHSISSTSITQEVIANVLETGRYEKHLRKLRHQLHGNYLRYIRAINEYFPAGTRVSRPQGGFVLWVELNKKIDTISLYEQAIRQRISIAPGRMFTLTRQFGNCMRLNFGLNWAPETERALKTLGKLARQQFQ